MEDRKVGGHRRDVGDDWVRVCKQDQSEQPKEKRTNKCAEGSG